MALGLVTGIGWFVYAEQPFRHSATPEASPVKIVSENWIADPTFGFHGAVIWTVEVENTGDRYIESVQVEFSTYEESGRIITSASHFIRGLGPHARRSGRAYATYFGTEKSAQTRVGSVRYAGDG